MVQGHAVILGACPLCGSRELVALAPPARILAGPWGDVGALGLRSCARCGFDFVDPRPSTAALDAFYRAQDYTAHEPVDDLAARRRAAQQLAVIERAGHRLAGARLLDLGCGGGQLLAQARDRGAAVVGVDPASHAHAACQRLGIRVAASLEELAMQRFDGAVMSHVLEHVADVAATLLELRARLAPAGWLCVEVPNRASLRARLSPGVVTRLGADERYRAFPIHLSYFTPATLTRALAAAGFAVERMTTAGLGLQALLPQRGSSRGAAEQEVRATSAGEVAATTPSSGPAAVRRGWRARGRDALKRGYFDALFGENLIAVAHLRDL
jgi:2-polyprenyl-3-methyl-5-hydroxy-6-metoxy-1,4-benzoquinol methylase